MLKRRREIQTSNHKVRDPDVRHRRAKTQTSQHEESDIAARRVRHHGRQHPPTAVRQDRNSPPDTMSVSLPFSVTAWLLFFLLSGACLRACFFACLSVCRSSCSARLLACCLPACCPACLPCLLSCLLALLRARMACPRAFLLIRLSAGLLGYDPGTGAASGGNWHSRRAKHAVEEGAEIESAPSYCRRRAKGVLF